MWFVVVCGLSSACFVVDLVLNFFVGYEEPVTGDVQRALPKISSHYLRTYFFIDFVSVLPFFIFDDHAGDILQQATADDGT